jgi:hypothetical protein
LRPRGLGLFVVLAGLFNFEQFAAAEPALKSVCPVVRGTVDQGAIGGWLESAPRPLEAAIRLQLAGQEAFQKRRYEEARRLFQASLAADSSYQLPRLGLACIAVRKDQFDLAAGELSRLFMTAFVPWYQEAKADIDLAALWTRISTTVLPDAIKEAAASWGQRVSHGVLLLSRLAPPVHLAADDGPSLFRPSQEIISWDPMTGRHYQVTSEGGRVVAFVSSADGRSLLYMTAQKVRREGGRLTSFQSVGVHLLRLSDMHLVSRRLVGPDARLARVELSFDKGKAYVLAVSQSLEEFPFLLNEDLHPLQSRLISKEGGVVVTPSRLEQNVRREFGTPATCHFGLKPSLVNGIPTVEVVAQNGSRIPLQTRFGLGLNGLPLPGTNQPK